MLIIDEKNPGSAPKPSIFLHGVTGAGKSTWATRGGRPLVILTEPKAMSILRMVNPEAIGMVPQSTKDIFDIFVLLGQPERLEARGIDRIVLDSFTDLTYSLPAWMKDPSGVQILLKMEIQEFGDLKNYALALVKAIQLAGYPSIIIARSTVKRVGRVEKIVPDGYGKSVEELPGKCLPTVEARYDAELGYVMDTSPDECSQRCGLPWVPAVFQGSALEFLNAVGKPQAVVAPAPTSATPGAFAKVVEEEQAAKLAGRPEVSEEQIWDAIAGTAPAAKPGQITVEQFTALCDMAKTQKVDMAALELYAKQRGDLLGDTLSTMKPESYEKFMPILRDGTRSAGLKAHLATLAKNAA